MGAVGVGVTLRTDRCRPAEKTEKGTDSEGTGRAGGKLWSGGGRSGAGSPRVVSIAIKNKIRRREWPGRSLAYEKPGSLG